jgi:hypothetical protein
MYVLVDLELAEESMHGVDWVVPVWLCLVKKGVGRVSVQKKQQLHLN